MTVFELGMFASPVAGLVAGIRAAEGEGAWGGLFGAVAGLVIGAVVFVGPCAVLGLSLSRVTGAATRWKREELFVGVLGTSLVLSAITSPVAAWFVSGWVISGVLGGAG